MNNNPEVDIFSQCDESGVCCSNKNNCSNICSGVMVFRNKKELYPLLEYKDEDIISFKGDQQYLTDLFKKEGIRYLTIDKHIMPNGCFYDNFTRAKVTFDESACLVHFNYMVGSQKERTMRLQNLWLI